MSFAGSEDHATNSPEKKYEIRIAFYPAGAKVNAKKLNSKFHQAECGGKKYKDVYVNDDDENHVSTYLVSGPSALKTLVQPKSSTKSMFKHTVKVIVEKLRFLICDEDGPHYGMVTITIHGHCEVGARIIAYFVFKVKFEAEKCGILLSKIRFIVVESDPCEPLLSKKARRRRESKALVLEKDESVYLNKILYFAAGGGFFCNPGGKGTS